MANWCRGPTPTSMSDPWRLPLRQLRVRAERPPYAGKNLQGPPNIRSAEVIPPRSCDFDDSCRVARLTPAKQLVIDHKNNPAGCLCPSPVRWRGLGDDGERTSPCRHRPTTIHLARRGMGMAELLRILPKAQGHAALSLAEYRRPDRGTSAMAKAPASTMICTISSTSGARRLCRRDDAGLAGPRRRMPGQTSSSSRTATSILRSRTASSRHHPRTAIDLARRRAIEVIERASIRMNSARSRVLITGTAAEITPVSEIGSGSSPPARSRSSLMADYTRSAAEGQGTGGVSRSLPLGSLSRLRGRAGVGKATSTGAASPPPTLPAESGEGKPAWLPPSRCADTNRP